MKELKLNPVDGPALSDEVYAPRSPGSTLHGLHRRLAGGGRARPLDRDRRRARTNGWDAPAGGVTKKKPARAEAGRAQVALEGLPAEGCERRKTNGQMPGDFVRSGAPVWPNSAGRLRVG